MIQTSIDYRLQVCVSLLPSDGLIDWFLSVDTRVPWP